MVFKVFIQKVKNSPKTRLHEVHTAVYEGQTLKGSVNLCKLKIKL